MKDTADITYHHNFSRIARQQKRKKYPLALSSIKRSLLPYKQQLVSGIATLGIGSLLLLSIYLFFIQLAEYGW